MIIVTGGAGFIGSNLVEALERKGVGDIVVCDLLGSGDKWRNIAKRSLRDIIKPEDLLTYLDAHRSQVKMIFHMGAISSTTETDADLIVDTNFTLSRKLWLWCAEHNTRFVYASSAATYGDGSQGFQDDETPSVLAKLQPLNPYGWSKHAFDRRVSGIVHQTQSEPVPPQWVGLKFFNVYGPNEYHKGEQMSVVCKLYPQVIAGAAARLFKSYRDDYEDGGQLRDFVYVDDCVDVMLWFLDNPRVNGLFNVGSGKARSFKDLALATFAASGKSPKISYIDMPQTLQAKYQYFTEANMSKLRSVGYTKELTSLEDGIAKYVQNFLSQVNPYR